ncbi:MAG: glycosyl hydrolase [Candidatus Eisenbacteria bacterium]
MIRRLRGLTWLVMLLASGALVGCVDSSGDTGRSPEARERGDARGSGRRDLDWGIYQIYWGRHYEEMLSRSVEPLASGPNFVMFYRDLGRGFPHRGCETIRSRGAVPIVSLELWHWGAPENYLPRINDGEFDTAFRDWAREARDFGSPVYLRFGFEMNGDWFGWGGHPDLFVRAWRRARHIFQEEGASNVVWVWSPNAISIPREPWNQIDAYYPGDDVVDWVGLDGYNFGDHHSEWHRWESFEEVFGPALDLVARSHASKPVMIAEFGCAPGRPGQRASWIRDAHAYVLGRPEIRAAVWFSLDKSREGEPDWSFQGDPEAITAFNETFARPR